MENNGKPEKMKCRTPSLCGHGTVPCCNCGFNAACDLWEAYHDKVMAEKDKEIEELNYCLKENVEYRKELESEVKELKSKRGE